MNIYIVDRLEGAGGCAKDIPSSSFIIGSDGVFSTNICHELGHCLGLFHTHETAFCVENIARNNCSDCGDFICDTPADPNLTGRLDGSTCTYINPITQNGVSYTPDTRNLMSYGCKEKLTPMQTKAIINRASISSDRNTSLAIPTINGASAFCTSTTLTVSNIRMGYSVNWESSNTAVATVSISGTVNKVSDGTVTITAEITNGNDAHFVTKTLSVGKPTVIDGSYTRGSYTYPVSGTYNGITVSSSLPYVYITMQPLSSDIISYNWTKVSAYKSHSFAYSANQATVYLSSGAYANITCTWNNACGSSPVVSFNCYNYSAFRLVASPNAVSQTLTVEAQLLSEAEAQNSTEKLLKSKDKNNIIVKLRDKNGNIVDSGKLKDGILKLNVAHLPNDTYFLQMSEDDELVVKQIVVRH